MASIGLSKPIIALYNAESTEVSYSDVVVIGKAIKLDMALEEQEDRVVYGDCGPVEACNEFCGGTITLGTDELSPDAMTKTLGTVTDNIGGVNWIVFNDDQETPYVGLGAIAKKQVNGAIKFVAIIYPKILFQNFYEALVTQGETVEWNTPEIEAILMRDDTEKHEWRRISEPLETETEAESAIYAFFGFEKTYTVAILDEGLLDYMILE